MKLNIPLRLGKPVLYVLGNHEFYGSSLDGAAAELKRLCAGTPVRVLDDGEAVVAGVRFLGSTLWTDFELFGSAPRRDQAMAEGARMLRDFSRIRLREAGQDLFTPADAAMRFRRHAAWLDGRLREPHPGPTVVITHHAPSPRSIHPRFDPHFIVDVEVDACDRE